MNKLIICCGISGSGKSTWSTEFINKHPNTFKINRDSIRLGLIGILDGYYERRDLGSIEMKVTNIEDCIFEELIASDCDIIIDNTNLKQSYLNRWIQLSQNTNYHIEFKLFDISLEDAQRRLLEREGSIDLSYVNKQFEQYKQIKKYLETNYKDQIL